MSFQDELNKATRSASETDKFKRSKDFKDGAKVAVSSYYDIKKQLLKMANEGKYINANGKKQINIYYNDSSLNWYAKLHIDQITINQSFFNRRGTCAHKAYYTLTNPSFYDGYIQKLKELGSADNISIEAVGYYNDHNKKVDEFPLIGGSLIGTITMNVYLSIRIKCVVEY